MTITLFDEIEDEIERLSDERVRNCAYIYAQKIILAGLRLK
jgi:hypothetical protein